MSCKDLKKLKKIVWISFIFLLPPVLVAEFYIHPHAVFEVEKLRFFYAIFGLLSCIAIVLVSKVLGIFVKRSEEYYKESNDG